MGGQVEELDWIALHCFELWWIMWQWLLFFLPYYIDMYTWCIIIIIFIITAMYTHHFIRFDFSIPRSYQHNKRSFFYSEKISFFLSVFSFIIVIMHISSYSSKLFFFHFHLFTIFVSGQTNDKIDECVTYFYSIQSASKSPPMCQYVYVQTYSKCIESEWSALLSLYTIDFYPQRARAFRNSKCWNNEKEMKAKRYTRIMLLCT